MNREKMRVGFYGCGQFAQSKRIPGVLAAGGDVFHFFSDYAEARLANGVSILLREENDSWRVEGWTVPRSQPPDSSVR